VVGSLLHRAGTSVTLIARGPHLAAIQSGGLRLVTPAVDVTQLVPAVSGPGEITWTGEEVVLVAVKSDATGAVAAELAGSAPASIRVVSLQNGVGNEPMLARWFAHVYGITVMAPTTHLEPGVVRAKSAGVPAILDIGCWPTGVDDTCTAVAAAFAAAGMVSEPRPDIMAWKYRKLLMSLGNVVDAFCVADEAADSLTEQLRVEAERVLSAAGIAVTPEAVDRARRGDLLHRGPSSAPTGGSTWQSLARGTGTIETDQLNGEIVRLGSTYGVATPLNSRAVELAQRLLESGAAPRSMEAGVFLA
jgi:2-dehydropantoate 2-reductase